MLVDLFQNKLGMGLQIRNEKSVFIELKRDPSSKCIEASWMGMLATEDITKGGLAVIEELKSTGFRRIFNDNRQVIGDWREANDWLSKVWLPMALEQKLERFAHVLSPYYYGKLSAEELQKSVNGRFEMMLFKCEKEAKSWLCK